MATTDIELLAEVRGLTRVPAAKVSDTDIEGLIATAKREIEAKTGKSHDYYASPTAERALFWLTCLFVKIHTGEIEGARTRIDTLEIVPLTMADDKRVSIWWQEFTDYFGQLPSTTSRFAGSHRRISRSDRTYGGN